MDRKSALPRFLLEDCLELLRGLVVLAWVAFFAALATEVWIRSATDIAWPEFGGFSLTYNILLAGFGLNTMVLTALLVYRDWYERVPRASVERLRWLMVIVLVWEGLHFFGAFHITGSLHGTLALMIPVILVAALVYVPGWMGYLLAAYLLAGTGAVLWLGRAGIISDLGPLAQAFAYPQQITGAGVISILLALIFLLCVTVAIRRRLFPLDRDLRRLRRYDSDTGLFDRDFLNRRIQQEINRLRRQGGGAALLVIRFEERGRGESVEAKFRNAANSLLTLVRLNSDTPARLTSNALAVLLQATNQEGAMKAAQRILSGLSGAEPAGDFVSALVLIDNGDATVGQVVTAANAAMSHAASGAEPVVVTVGGAG